MEPNNTTRPDLYSAANARIKYQEMLYAYDSPTENNDDDDEDNGDSGGGSDGDAHDCDDADYEKRV